MVDPESASLPMEEACLRGVIHLTPVIAIINPFRCNPLAHQNHILDVMGRDGHHKRPIGAADQKIRNT